MAAVLRSLSLRNGSVLFLLFLSHSTRPELRGSEGSVRSTLRPALAVAFLPHYTIHVQPSHTTYWTFGIVFMPLCYLLSVSAVWQPRVITMWPSSARFNESSNKSVKTTLSNAQFPPPPLGWRGDSNTKSSVETVPTS